MIFAYKIFFESLHKVLQVFRLWFITNNTVKERINVTMRYVRVTIVQWKSNKYYIFWLCVSILSYPACKTHAPCYIVACPHKRHEFREKRVLEIKCFSIFSATYVWNISHSKNNLARYYHKLTLVFRWSTRYACKFLMKLEFFDRFSKNSPYIKFHGTASNEKQVFPCRWTATKTDRETWRS